MKRLYIFLLLVVAVFFISACDKIEPPYTEKPGGGGGGDPETVVRKVLLEDYTGHRCVNCAGASITAHDLKKLYSDRLIIMSVHAGDFAQPVPGSIFEADYRTETGNTWNSFFGIQAYPSGMVNRLDYNGETVLPENKWGAAIEEALKPEADADIKINNEYDAGVVKTTIKVKFLHEMSDNYALQVCITEDSIISPQLNNDETAGEVPVIEKFVFMHMLRGAVNGSWGEDIFGGAIEQGREYSVSYNYTIKGVAKNSHVVAFVYDKSDKSIVQVEQEPVTSD